MTQILDAIDDIIIIADPEGTIAYRNDRAEILGRHQDPTGPRMLALLDQGRQWKTVITRVVQTGSPERFETDWVDQSGERHSVAVNVVPLRDTEGDMAAVGVIVRDMGQIMGLKAELEHRDRELEACAKETDAFVSTISHDLRTPMISVQGFANLLVKKYRDHLDEKGIQYLDRLKYEADRMDRLLQDARQGSPVRRAAEPKPDMG
jgi:PAS domain S-box-containing protein